MAFIPRIIEKFLDFANLKRHNDNFQDIANEFTALDGRIQSNTAAIDNRYTKAEADAKDAAVSSAALTALNTHKASGDHDARYYTKVNMQTSGGSLIHWENITDKPNFADARWKSPVKDKATLDALLVGNTDGDIRLVLADETVYEWDADTAGANKWRPIGAMGNGLTSHSSLTNLSNDDHKQYHNDARGDARYYRKDEIDVQMAGKIQQNGKLTGDLDFSSREAKNLVVHRAAVEPAQPVEGQLWYHTGKKAMYIYKGATLGWVDISGKGAVIRDQEFTALPGQTVFDITVGRYETNTNAITVYKKYVTTGTYELVPEADYTESSETSFTLIKAAAGGEAYYVKFFENSPEVINESVKRDGTLQVNLNAEMLNGRRSTDFASSIHGANHVTGGSDVIPNAVSGGSSGLMSGADKLALDNIQKDLATSTSKSITLNKPVQVVTADRTSRLKLDRFKGRTLVNLVGRDGNCEDASRWIDYQTSHALDTTNYVSGKSSLKVILSSGFTTGSAITANPVSFVASKYYLLAGWLKNGNANYMNLSVSGQGAATATNTATSTSAFTFAYKAFTGVSTTSTGINVSVNGAAGQYGYADEVRVYELSKAEYDAISGMTTEDIDAKYPYVDAVQHTTNPYVIRLGENLVPASDSWIVPVPTRSSITGPYSTTMQYNASENVYVEFFVPVVPGQQYTATVTAEPANASPYYYYTDANKIRLTAMLRGTSVAPAKAALIEFVMKPVDVNLDPVSGNVIYSNPVIALGDVSKPFKPREDDYLFFPDLKLAANMDGSVSDEITQRDGKYWKRSCFTEKAIDPKDFGTVNVFNLSGFKEVDIGGFKDTGIRPLNAFGVRYDGTLLKYSPGASTGANYFDFNETATLYITIPNADSGWGDSYTPTADEVKAYFLGYKMYLAGGPGNVDYNGTGTKAWAYRTSAGYQEAGITLPTTQAPNYTPYRIAFQLAQPAETEIIPEGSITLHEGLNHIETGVGLFVREHMTSASSGNYYTSNDLGNSSTLFKNRVRKVWSIYRNRRQDKQWSFNNLSSYGLEKPVIEAQKFDPTAVYEVTYLALDPISAPLSSITASTDTNLKKVVDTLAQTQADVETRLSMLERSSPNKAQAQWITATLLNGWVVNVVSPAYMRDGFGFVHLKGSTKSGAVAAGTVLFVLPPEYRAKSYGQYTLKSDNGTNAVYGTLAISEDGKVTIYHNIGNAGLFLDGISFPTF
ncbi:hypothetical protein PC41400_21565 [Paenibacillus chitinolyticus]|uniref:Tail fiber protein n=1 Tax=Paenibacillus chitinolyticus TaxID=79263 RepID=A0A410X0H8_9BACL|nr:hypothetical protein [Paenibacillus chitinolyticus]MCY9593717.1 hypothetical protein [Paenibacillus chitinolyticus]MCY9599717.1 hypothetical protein [Paenibacillus chitinolyticus]QAV20110.1 hypothetical protein PC41400_21565 [Paenibacillus chitinolyticus]